MKRGISTLVSTILLIGLVIAISALIFLWAQTQTETIIQQTSSEASKLISCSEVNIEIVETSIINNTSISLTLRNNNFVDIAFFIIKIDSSLDSYTFQGTGLSSFGQAGRIITHSLPGEILSLEVIPIIMDKTEIICRSYSVSSEYFPSFTGSSGSGGSSGSSGSSGSGGSGGNGGTPTGFLPAFPGAEGFGAKSIGGRGGTVIEVTNLNDSGPGSLRQALEFTSGPRIVVFKVSGEINVSRELDIFNPYITIAGQTAPGKGITLRKDGSQGGTPLRIKTHDVIIQHLRIRSGTTTSIGGDGSTTALTIVGNSYNIIIDHLSMSWGIDGILNVAGSHDITFQWNILSEPLRCSNHWETINKSVPIGYKGPTCPAGGVVHGRTMLISIDQQAGNISSYNMTLHHNLFAHSEYRNPQISGTRSDAFFDLVNNIIYNYIWRPVTPKGSINLNNVKNYYKPGLSTWYNLSTYPGIFDGFYSTTLIGGPMGGPNQSIYFEGNHLVSPIIEDIAPAFINSTTNKRHPYIPITETSALQAYDDVLADAGAILPERDSVDQRIVNDVINGTGMLIDHPNEVGGWLNIPPAVGYLDTDVDGMPDSWELTYGFNPNDVNDGPQDLDGDGYTNVEEFLHNIDPTVADN